MLLIHQGNTKAVEVSEVHSLPRIVKRDDSKPVTFPSKRITEAEDSVKLVSGHHVLFEPVGSLVGTVSYIHLEVDLQYGQFLTQVQKFEENMNKIESKTRKLLPTQSKSSYSLTTKPDWNAIFSSSSSSISQTIDNVISIIDLERLELVALKDRVNLLNTMLPDLPIEDKRVKRAFFLPLLIGLVTGAVGALGVTGTLMGSYNQEDLNKLGKGINDIQSSLDKVVKILTSQDDLLNAMDKNIQDMSMNLNILTKSNPTGLFAQMEYQRKLLSRKINQLIEVVQVASLHRLSAEAMSAVELQNAFSKLHSEAKRMNLNLVASQPGHLLQLETTLMRKGNSELVLIVHVPLVDPQHEFLLYRYHPVPIVFDHEATLLIHSEEKLLAVGPEGDHKILMVEDLEKCDKFKDLYLCEYQSVSNLHSNSSCLSSLHQLDEEGVRKLCPIKSGNVEETVYQLDHNRFLVYLPTAFNLKIQCVGKPTSHLHLAEGHTDLPLDPGCTANLRKHKLSTGTSLKIKGKMTYFVWNWNPLVDFDELARQEVSKNIKSGHMKNTRGVLLDDLRKDVERQQKENHWDNHTFGFSAGSIGTTILTIVIFSVSFCCLCKQRKQISKCFKSKPHQDDHVLPSLKPSLIYLSNPNPAFEFKSSSAPPPPPSPSSIHKFF